MLSFNQKETSLLNDQKKHEELCIKKYSSYANQTQDQELKQMFNAHGQQEQQHLDSLNKMLSGQLPNTSGQQGGQQKSQQEFMQQSAQTSFPSIQQGGGAQANQVMCEDLLSTEKYVSSTYNTAIFEFKDPGVRQVLNHIQKEEQEHGQDLYAYMAAHGMYNA